MTEYSLKFSTQAVNDLMEIRQYSTITFGIQQAENYEEGLKTTINAILLMPSRGHHNRQLANDQKLLKYIRVIILFIQY